MNTNTKKAAVLLAAMMMPATAYAQDEQAGETTSAPAEETAAAQVAEAPAATEAPAAAPAPAEQVNISQQVQAGRDSKNARKEAMRNLSQAYPEGGSSEAPAVAPPAAENTAAQPVASPAYIPPSFKTTERMPHFEHHGYLRGRLNYFGRYDLNTRGTSPVGVPLESDQRNENQQKNVSTSDTNAHFGANMRFRYQPTVHITESIRVAGSFDVLDNLVLGTTPNGLRENWGSSEFFSFNGAMPVNGDTMAANAISIKALYGEADTILGTFRFGRIPTHWGLGIVYNDGGVYKRDQQITEGHGWKCLECDSSDAVDKVEWRIRDPFFNMLYLQFSWDFVNSGIASYSTLQSDSIGQAIDLGETDDVLQFTISVFDRPISREEVEQRARSLFVTRDWTADWGVFYSYREQEHAASPETAYTYVPDGAGTTYDLFAKDATAHTFDLWGRFFIPLPKEVMLRLEAEFVGVIGSVALDTTEDQNGEERDILQFGGALEAEVWWRDLTTGIKTGFAWSDNMVFSGHPMIEKTGRIPMGSIFRFDSSYRVDEIMFHELMGGINNAWFLNMFGEYKFPLELSQMTLSLGARLDLMTATALKSSATPGESTWYGFEADLKVFYEESDRFRFEIGAGLFVPGQAWAKIKNLYPTLPNEDTYNDSNERDPDIAWNVIANLYFMF